MSLKVLNIAQPHAHHIFHKGKNIENRSRPTKIRGTIAIYASKTVQPWRFEDTSTWIEDCEYGVILGFADLVDCVSEDTADKSNPWWIGPFGYLLENIRLLPKPIKVTPPKGAIIWWNIEDAALESLNKQLPPAFKISSN